MTYRSSVPRILILGGGYVGMYTALRLQRKLQPGEARDHRRRPALLHDLPAVPARGGGRQPRAAPRRRAAAPRAAQAARSSPAASRRSTTRAEVATVAAASRGAARPRVRHPRRRPRLDRRARCRSPASPRRGIGFKTVEEAIALRNRVLEPLDIAASTTDEPAAAPRALTFVFVGGGYAGIEALGRAAGHGPLRDALLRRRRAGDLRLFLVEATGRIMPEVGEDMGRVHPAAAAPARHRHPARTPGWSPRVDGHVVLSDGDEFDADTLVWTAGVKPNPLPRAHRPAARRASGRVQVHRRLRVEGVDRTRGRRRLRRRPRPHRTPARSAAPSAQHAVRQARGSPTTSSPRCAASGRRRTGTSTSARSPSLGLYKGVAQVYGIKLRGFPAWFMHRTYHLTRMPTLNRKARIIVDWTLAMFFSREIVSIGALADPRREFEYAAAARARGRPPRRPGPYGTSGSRNGRSGCAPAAREPRPVQRVR